MKINELKGKQLETLLSELFGLKGAKEVFAKHNIEMRTKEIEIDGMNNIFDGIAKLFAESKTAQDYKQAVMFLDTQINTNKSMLATAEGFMKTMLEGMIQSFEVSKQTAVMSQSELFRKELHDLLDYVVDEDDKAEVKKLIAVMTLDKLEDFQNKVKETLSERINNRYSDVKETAKEVVEEKVEVKQEEAKSVKKETKKKEEKVEKAKVEEDIIDGLDDVSLDDLDDSKQEDNFELDFDEQPKAEVKKPKEEKTEIKEETIDDLGDSFDGFDDENFELDDLLSGEDSEIDPF